MKTPLLLTLTCGALAAAMLQAAPVGVFDAGGDVGVTPKAGKAEFDAASGESDKVELIAGTAAFSLV